MTPLEFKEIDEQTLIIESSIDDRIFVEAQPGTGKTAVACARVIRLIQDEDIAATSILMISFTRTAVAEMKNRIRNSLPIGIATSINIATLDRTAFSFGIGCGSKFEELMGSFDDNIEQAIQQLENNNPLLFEYLSHLKHIIIDEAQDITGSRAKLVSLILSSLNESTGVTVFADALQAIYGFTNDFGSIENSDNSLSGIFNFEKNGYQCVSLKEIHRTKDKKLLDLFLNTRTAALDLVDGKLSPEKVIEQIKNHGESHGSDITELPLKDNDLLLFRKRASALMASQFCPDVFRLRLPGYQAAVFPWIAIMFWNWRKPTATRQEFDILWQRIEGTLDDGFDNDRAWNLLLHFASNRSDLDLLRLRSILSRNRPPVELCYLDYGGHGPIFSTIHSSKGREADRVFLMLPQNVKDLNDGPFINSEEEARVFYVGATRVKKEFFHGVAMNMIGAGRLDESGRRVTEVLNLNKKPKFQFGLQGDINELGIISRNEGLCATQNQAEKNHANLLSLWKNSKEKGELQNVSGLLCQVDIDGVKKYLYSFTSARNTIAFSGDGLDRDLWATANKLQEKAHSGRLRPPEEIKPLRLIGLRTCAIAPDSPLEYEVHEPFAKSGFFLAPMIVGFPSIFFIFQRKK